MKPEIHPNYADSKIICACGTVHETRATKSEIHVDICSACHPFYTGKQKLVDTAGRVDRFNRKYNRKPLAETPVEAPAEAAVETPAEA